LPSSVSSPSSSFANRSASPAQRAGTNAEYISSGVVVLVNDRYEKRHPTIVTTNRGLPDWSEVFGDSVVASAILDRLMHHAIVFNIR
jgi:DNA replication protein DnaC